MEKSSEKQWYYTSRGQRHGPVPISRLKELVAQDHIDRFDDLVWAEGMEDWIHASEVDGLFTGAPPPSIPVKSKKAPAMQAPVKRASYGLYVSLVVPGAMVGLLATFFLWVAYFDDATPPDELLAVIGLLYFILMPLTVAVVVVAMVYLYRAWAMIQDDQVRVTPGKAVGFMFIPLYNLYWVFVAYPGWAKNYNRYIEIHQFGNAPRMPVALFQTFAILVPVNIVLQYIPVLDILMLIAILVINLTVYRYICSAINFMAKHGVAESNHESRQEDAAPERHSVSAYRGHDETENGSEKEVLWNKALTDTEGEQEDVISRYLELRIERMVTHAHSDDTDYVEPDRYKDTLPADVISQREIVNELLQHWDRLQQVKRIDLAIKLLKKLRLNIPQENNPKMLDDQLRSKIENLQEKAKSASTSQGVKQQDTTNATMLSGFVGELIVRSLIYAAGLAAILTFVSVFFRGVPLGQILSGFFPGWFLFCLIAGFIGALAQLTNKD